MVSGLLHVAHEVAGRQYGAAFGGQSAHQRADPALYLGAWQRLISVPRERAERAEREQRLLAEQARADERARLAGEMHDVVTHRLSLMVLSAGALRMITPDEATRQAAEGLRATGCQALDELRDLVGILRTAPDTGTEQAQPSVPDLAALAAESRSAGIPTELVEEARPGACLAGRRTNGLLAYDAGLVTR